MSSAEEFLDEYGLTPREFVDSEGEIEDSDGEFENGGALRVNSEAQ